MSVPSGPIRPALIRTIKPSSLGLFTMSDYKALDINIEARVKPPEVIWHQTIKA